MFSLHVRGNKRVLDELVDLLWREGGQESGTVPSLVEMVHFARGSGEAALDLQDTNITHTNGALAM